jgi:GDPmannose 4,6-dehydratase
MKRALICGISGQDGAYLARLLLEKGYEVHGTSRDAQLASFGSLAALGIRERVQVRSMAVTDFRSVLQVLLKVAPDEIYNLAGQTSVGLSFDQPVETHDSISMGTLNLLEGMRILDLRCRYYNAGSSESFGDTGGVPADEATPFRPRSPYGVAKAASFWMVANYRESYGRFACSGILFNHESPLRPARFVTQKIIEAACRIAAGDARPLILGNLDVARDWGWAPEYVDAMWRMLQQQQPHDYVIATGSSYSLRAFVDCAFAAVGLDAARYLTVDPSLARPSDIAVSRGDPSRAAAELDWRALRKMPEVVGEMVKARLGPEAGGSGAGSYEAPQA